MVEARVSGPMEGVPEQLCMKVANCLANRVEPRVTLVPMRMHRDGSFLFYGSVIVHC